MLVHAVDGRNLFCSALKLVYGGHHHGVKCKAPMMGAGLRCNLVYSHGLSGIDFHKIVSLAFLPLVLSSGLTRIPRTRLKLSRVINLRLRRISLAVNFAPSHTGLFPALPCILVHTCVAKLLGKPLCTSAVLPATAREFCIHSGLSLVACQ